MIILLLCYHDLYCENFEFNQFTTKNGLPQNSIYSIETDTFGFIWVGTEHGLSRFDGYSFQSSESIFSESSVLGKYIQGIKSDGYYLWIVTRKGVSKINLLSNASANFPFVEDIPHHIIDIELFDNKLWIACEKEIFNINENGEYYNYKSFEENITDLEVYNNTLLISSDSLIYSVNNDDGLSFTRFETFGAIKMAITNSDNLLFIGADRYLYKRRQDRSEKLNYNKLITPTDLILYGNEIIVGTKSHGLWINGDYLLNANNQTSIRSSVTSLFTSKSNLWIGTYSQGLFSYNKNYSCLQSFSISRGNDLNVDSFFLKENIVWSFEEKDSSNLYIGTNNGIVLLSERDQSLQYDFFKKDLFTSPVFEIKKSKNNTYIGTGDGRLLKFNKKNNSLELIFDFNDSDLDIRSIYFIDSNTILLGTSKKLFVIKENEKLISKSYEVSNVVSIEKYPNKDSFLLASFTDGLFYFEKNKKLLKKITLEKDYSITDILIPKIYSDSIIVLGTKGEGVVFVSFEDFKELPITKKPTSKKGYVVNGILEDLDGNLWFISNYGLHYIKKNSCEIFSYSVLNGHSIIEYAGGSHFKSINSDFYFGGINGFQKFNPKSALANDLYNDSYPVVLTNVLIGNSDSTVSSGYINYNKEIEFSYDDRPILFEFSRLQFFNHDQINYRVIVKKLNMIFEDEIDTILIQAPLKNTFNFNFSAMNDLSLIFKDKTYILRIQASNHFGVFADNYEELEFKVVASSNKLYRNMFVSFVIFLICSLYVSFRIYIKTKVDKIIRVIFSPYDSDKPYMRNIYNHLSKLLDFLEEELKFKSSAYYSYSFQSDDFEYKYPESKKDNKKHKLLQSFINDNPINVDEDGNRTLIVDGENLLTSNAIKVNYNNYIIIIIRVTDLFFDDIDSCEKQECVGLYMFTTSSFKSYLNRLYSLFSKANSEDFSSGIFLTGLKSEREAYTLNVKENILGNLNKDEDHMVFFKSLVDSLLNTLLCLKSLHICIYWRDNTVLEIDSHSKLIKETNTENLPHKIITKKLSYDGVEVGFVKMVSIKNLSRQIQDFIKIIIEDNFNTYYRLKYEVHIKPLVYPVKLIGSDDDTFKSYLQKIFNNINEYFGTNYCSIWLKDVKNDEGNRYIQKFPSRGISDICDSYGKAKIIDNNTIENILTPLLINQDSDHDAKQYFNSFLRRNNFTSFIIVPILHKESTQLDNRDKGIFIGFINIYFKRDIKKITSFDYNFLTLISGKGAHFLQYNKLWKLSNLRTNLDQDINKSMRELASSVREIMFCNSVALFWYEDESSFRDFVFEGDLYQDKVKEILEKNKSEHNKLIDSHVERVIKRQNSNNNYFWVESKKRYMSLIERYNQDKNKYFDQSFFLRENLKTSVMGFVNLDGFKLVYFYNFRYTYKETEENIYIVESINQAIKARLRFISHTKLLEMKKGLAENRANLEKERRSHVEKEFKIIEEKLDSILPRATAASFYQILQGINHDTNSILSSLGRKMKKLNLSNITNSPEIDSLKEDIEKTAEKAQSILALFSVDNLDSEWVDIVEVLGELIKYFNPIETSKNKKIDENFIEVTLNINGSRNDIPEIYCKKIEISMIFYNLINNARQALTSMSSGTKVWGFKEEKKKILIDLIYRNNYYYIRVKDNGPGIENDIIGKIFDYNFTTKDVNLDEKIINQDIEKGLGIGLYFVKRVVENHYLGSIEVNTSLGKYTEFNVALNKHVKYA